MLTSITNIIGAAAETVIDLTTETLTIDKSKVETSSTDSTEVV